MKITIDNIKQAIRNPYTWPGGYPTIFYCADGGILCPSCAHKEYRIIRRAMVDGYDDQWVITDQDVLWENPDSDSCDHCYKILESAY